MQSLPLPSHFPPRWTCDLDAGLHIVAVWLTFSLSLSRVGGLFSMTPRTLNFYKYLCENNLIYL